MTDPKLALQARLYRCKALAWECVAEAACLAATEAFRQVLPAPLERPGSGTPITGGSMANTDDTRTEDDPFQEGYDLGCEETYRSALIGLCAYNLGVGSCSFGCIEEPSCHTDRWGDGWPSDPYVQPLLELLPPKRHEVAYALRTGGTVERWDLRNGWQRWSPVAAEVALLAVTPTTADANWDRLHGFRITSPVAGAAGPDEGDPHG